MRKGVVVASLISGSGVFAMLLYAESYMMEPSAQIDSVSRDYAVSGFTGVSTAGPQDIEIVTGDEFSVRAEGIERELDQLEVLVEDGVLVVRARRDRENNWNWSWDSDTTFYVTAPAISSVALAGAGNLLLDKAEGERFSASISGPGDIDIGSITVDQANITINGSGDFTARGTANHSIVSITGEGDISANALTSTTATITVVGSGDAEMVVSEDADINLVGSGDVTIAGSATCRVSRAGSGDVSCGIIAGTEPPVLAEEEAGVAEEEALEEES